MRLLAMSGLVPEQICDTVRFLGYGGGERIPHYCGYASDYISMVREDPGLDGAVFPRSCDSSRTIKSYLSGCRKFTYQLPVPVRRDEAAVEFLAEVLKDYRRTLEEYFHVTIRDSEIRERTERIRARNRKLRTLYESLDGIPYEEYIRMVHGLLEKPLTEQEVPDTFHAGSESGESDKSKSDGNDVSDGAVRTATGRRTGTLGGRRVFLVGSTLADEAIAGQIERAGMKIVGDNLPESRRLCYAPEVKPGEELFFGIAGSMLGNLPSPTQENFRVILEADLAEIKKKAVRGVIFVTQKYCEPYDYLFYVYKKMLDETGIPVLKLCLTGSQDDGKTELEAEAFADLL